MQDGGPNANRHKKGPEAAHADGSRQHRQLFVDNGLQALIQIDRLGVSGPDKIHRHRGYQILPLSPPGYLDAYVIAELLSSGYFLP